MDRFDFNDDYVGRLRNREAETWRHFDAYFRPRVRAKFRAQFPWGMVDDLVEDVMVAVIERINQGEPREAPRLAGYVLSICDYKALEAIRRLGKEKVTDVDWDHFPANTRTPQQQSLSKELAAKIARVLAKLSSRDRDILVSVFYDGRDRNEVCGEYGVERDQLRLILFHARQRFQREWERE